MVTDPQAPQSPGDNESEPRPRRYIVTLYGLYARDEHNWLSVASIVRLMADLGVDGPAVRSSISRLKRREVLQPQRIGSTAGYSLSATALDIIAEGDVRIFDRKRGSVDDGWLVVVFSIPETVRNKRYALRSQLTRLGFGTVAPGVWIAPGHLECLTRQTLERQGLSAYVDMFAGDHRAFGDLRAKVGTWWDLDGLSALYAGFAKRYRPVQRRAAARGMPADEAYRIYLPMLTDWRRLPYLDPGLPASLLPAQWAGITAHDMFDDLSALLSGPAREHAMALIHR